MQKTLIMAYQTCHDLGRILMEVYERWTTGDRNKLLGEISEEVGLYGVQS